MKVYRIIEYEIPEDYTAAQHDWLIRTLDKSINGRYSCFFSDALKGCSITACELPAYSFDVLDVPEELKKAEKIEWTPPYPKGRQQQQLACGDVE